MVAVETVISSAINIYVGIIYIKISRVADIVLGMGKILVYLGVMQLLFGGSVVSSIIVFCVSYSVTHKVNKIKNRPKEETKMQTLASKVKNIKWLKETGKISAEEYEKKLNELLENNALNEINETKED